MESKTVANAQAMTDEQCKQEIDRMAIEIRAMLDEAGRRMERARRVGAENRRMMADLEKRISCWND